MVDWNLMMPRKVIDRTGTGQYAMDIAWTQILHIIVKYEMDTTCDQMIAAKI